MFQTTNQYILIVYPHSIPIAAPHIQIIYPMHQLGRFIGIDLFINSKFEVDTFWLNQINIYIYILIH